MINYINYLCLLIRNLLKKSNFYQKSYLFLQEIHGFSSWFRVFSSHHAGSCYSELSCRIPLMGSCYLYTYTVYGEIVAFVVAWNLILEALITIALAAQSLSHHLDMLADGQLDSWLVQNVGRLPWDQQTSPDIVAVGVIAFIAVAAVCHSKKVRLLGQFGSSGRHSTGLRKLPKHSCKSTCIIEHSPSLSKKLRRRMNSPAVTQQLALLKNGFDTHRNQFFPHFLSKRSSPLVL